MTSTATNKQQLLRIAAATLQELESGSFAPPPVAGARAAAEEAVGAPRDIVANSLAAALDWARTEDEVRGAAPGVKAMGAGADVPYIPSNQVLSLIQSAYDEYIESRTGTAGGRAGILAAFDPTDPGWVSVAWERLRALFRGKHKFIKHANVGDFRYELPGDAVVALFSDWGTGQETAVRVAQQMKAVNPTHAIHLGDVYYSGTLNEVKKRFLDILDQHGPERGPCRYYSLNANHDMYSGGYGYFDSILPHFGQEASYFNLRNEHWQLVGIDSGYEDHGLQDPQSEWLAAQLSAGGPRSILLSHHQLFSRYESRAFDRTLHKKVVPLLPGVYGWFWGHEHKCMIFGDHLGIRARCVGHGAIPVETPFGSPDFPNVPLVTADEREAPGSPGIGIHGFALLRFAGDALEVSYIDEFGDTFFSEQFVEGRAMAKKMNPHS